MPVAQIKKSGAVIKKNNKNGQYAKPVKFISSIRCICHHRKSPCLVTVANPKAFFIRNRYFLNDHWHLCLIMRKAGIRSRTKKKFKATTNSKHNFPVAPNLLNQKFTATAPDHTWVGDITYIHTTEGWLYLAVLLDLYNRKVVGWSTSSRLITPTGHRCSTDDSWISKPWKESDTPFRSGQPVRFKWLSE